MQREMGKNEQKINKPKTTKSKKDPLPMKLRALPQSFWQQPNLTGTSPPSAYEPLPLQPTEEQPTNLEISPADTDLLFSLFNALPSTPQPGFRVTARRGRPRKNKGVTTAKDEDPYVTSITVPEVKFQKEAMAENKIFAYMASDDKTMPAWQSYAQRLQDLAVNL